MIECTLQEAIKRCKENGGRCRRHDLKNNWIRVGSAAYLEYLATGRNVVFLAYDFESTWIYEPPKESAFQKWEREQPKYYSVAVLQGDVLRARKEGWNALADYLIENNNKTSGLDRCVTVAQIKELKEP